MVGGSGKAGVAQAAMSVYTPYSGTDTSEPDQVCIIIIYLWVEPCVKYPCYTLPKCKIEGSLRCERVDVNFEAIKTEEFITIEGVEFKRAEAREEEEQHAGMYSFIARETGGLAVFIIGQNEKNLTQVKTKDFTIRDVSIREGNVF